MLHTYILKKEYVTSMYNVIFFLKKIFTCYSDVSTAFKGYVSFLSAKYLLLTSVEIWSYYKNVPKCKRTAETCYPKDNVCQYLGLVVNWCGL